MGESRPRRGVPRKGQGVPSNRTLPQGAAQTGGVGRAALRGGEGMARIEAVQAKGTGEGERRGPHDRLGTKRQAARELRPQRPEEARDGGTAAATRKAILTPDPQTSHTPVWRFSTGWGVLGSPGFR